MRRRPCGHARRRSSSPDGARLAPVSNGAAACLALLESRCANTEEKRVTQSDQLILDRGAQAGEAASARQGGSAGESSAALPGAGDARGERAARRTLRAQVGRLERQLSAIVAERFPYIPAAGAEGAASDAGGEEPSCLCPSLL